MSHRREEKNRKVRKQGRASARNSQDQGISFGEIPDERAKWEARLRAGAIAVLAAAVGPEARPSRAASRRRSLLAADCIRAVAAAIIELFPRNGARDRKCDQVH